MVLRSANVFGIQSDDKILAAGASSNGVNDDILVLRLNPDGTADTGFGSGGEARIDTGSNEDPWDLAVGPDGSILVVGRRLGSAGYDSLIARLTPQGSLDGTFAPGGVAVQSFSTSRDEFNAVALQPDGRIVAVGTWTRTINAKSSEFDFLVARFVGDPPQVLLAPNDGDDTSGDWWGVPLDPAG
jgi:uncharacterized delta-60 repeat protein